MPPLGRYSFAGIVVVFWISVVPIELTLKWAAYRTVASLVIGSAALAPLLAGVALRDPDVVSEADRSESSDRGEGVEHRRAEPGPA